MSALEQRGPGLSTPGHRQLPAEMHPITADGPVSIGGCVKWPGQQAICSRERPDGPIKHQQVVWFSTGAWSRYDLGLHVCLVCGRVLGLIDFERVRRDRRQALAMAAERFLVLPVRGRIVRSA